MSTTTVDVPEAGAEAGEVVPVPSAGRRVWAALGRTAPVFAVLAVLLVWISIENPNFTDPPVFLSFLKRAAPLAVLAAGQYLVIVAGEFDLSVGSLVTVTVVVAAEVLADHPDGTVRAMATVLALGAVVGLANGLITTRLRVPSFITTLGMLLILEGAVDYWTDGAPKGALSEDFRALGRGGIDDVPWLEQLPWSVVVLAAVAVAAVLLMRSDFGKRLIAVGDNDRAAALSGVSVARTRTIAFVLSGLAAALAGILLGGFAGVSAQVGDGLEFEAITAVVLGGVVLGGGRGSVVAAVAGALTLEALFTLLNLLGLAAALQDAVEGLIIIAAVAFAAFRLRPDR
ncbi:MAG TPA: ABC transporter permease [Acidimicrobiales bacterium]